MSAALIREECKKQLPVYYVSQAFQGAKSKYPTIEKIVFALIVASRKLRQYFLGKSYPGDDGPTYQKVHEQTWGSWKNGPVGNSTQPIWH